MSTYLIGDIQGCYDPLQRLLEEIRFDPASDRLLSCGDVVSRGGQSLEVLRFLHSIRQSCSITLGNHDLHLLAADRKFPEGGCRNTELEHILQAHDRDTLVSWLNSQPLAVYEPGFNLLRVHAGVVPQWTCRQTLALANEISDWLHSDRREKFLRKVFGNRPNRWDEHLKGWARLRFATNVLTRIRFCNAKGKVLFKLSGPPGTQPRGYRPWYRHRHRKTREVTMAFGHWAARGLRMKKRYLALDSGCVWGGRLSAIRLEDRRLFQVEKEK